MELNYTLKQCEIEEAFLCLDWKKEGWRKYIHVGIMAMIACVCLVGYVADSRRIFLFWLAFLSVLFMFAILYFPVYRRRRKAAEMAKGVYKVKLPDTGILEGYESEHVFAIRTEKEIYCIPKRILKGSQQELIIHLLNEKAAKCYKITTGRKNEYE